MIFCVILFRVIFFCEIVFKVKEKFYFRDYIFNFHGFVKCQEEDCDLKRFINKVDDTLKSQCLGNKKKSFLHEFV